MGRNGEKQGKPPLWVKREVRFTVHDDLRLGEFCRISQRSKASAIRYAVNRLLTEWETAMRMEQAG